MRPNAKVIIIGLLLGLAISGLIGIARTRLITINDHNKPEAVNVRYHFFGDDSPGIETLKGNPHWSTERISKMFSGGKWRFLTDGRFVFDPGSPSSVRRDLFPMIGTYTEENGELLFRGERQSENTSGVASVDGVVVMEDEQATIEIIYAVVALDSQRIIRVSQSLMTSAEGELAAIASSSPSVNEPYFSGTWQLPVLETLALNQRGQRVEGTYSGRGGGQISGQAEGSWMRFTWQDSQGTGQGFFRAVSRGRTLTGFLRDGAGGLSNLLADRTSEVVIDDNELAVLNRDELKYQGYDYALGGQCDRALPYLDRALTLYKADRRGTDKWAVLEESGLIDEYQMSTTKRDATTT
jgi:hypothetical protein